MTRPHWSFWLIGTFMLLWNVGGSANFIVQLDPDMISAYRESEQAIIVNRPLWATVAFAVGVFGGTLGCLLLLLKKPAAFHVLVVSLVGIVVTIGHTLSVDFDFSLGETVVFMLMPVAAAAFLVLYSKYAEVKGWIKP